MAKTFLYQRISDDLSNAIQQGVYNPGNKLPSIRSLCVQYKVSMSTVLEAFALLEHLGLVQARPRSGYFVSDMPFTDADEPRTSKPSKQATSVNVGQLSMELVQEARSDRLIKLGAAVPGSDMLPSGQLARISASVLRKHPKSAIYYEDVQGNLSLRQQIARLMRQAACKISPDDIIVTNGCLEALSLALRSVTRAGDTVAIESPTYFGILQVIEALHLKALELPTSASNGVELSALEDALIKKKIQACVFMPSYSNPLGSCMPETSKQYMVHLLSKYKVPLIEDDIYATLGFDSGKRARPKAAKAYDENNNVILCSSFSKTLAPGFRIGWILPGRHKEKIAYAKFLDNISTSTLPQLALSEFLSRGHYQRHLKKSSSIYRQRLQQLRNWVAEYFPENTRISNPQGGFVLWVELPKQVDCMQLYTRAMAKKISISPGIIFSAQTRYTNHIRMSCGFVEGEIARNSVKVLGRIANDLLKQIS